MAIAPPYLSVITPNSGLKIPQSNNCNPITKPKCEIEISRSTLKSKKKSPKVCLIPREIITTTEAAISVISAFLLIEKLSVLI